jgi:hypothetical protein
MGGGEAGLEGGAPFYVFSTPPLGKTFCFGGAEAAGKVRVGVVTGGMVGKPPQPQPVPSQKV